MRVLLGVGWYFPDSIGGTEIYVRGLATELRQAGVDVAIAAPATTASATSHMHDGVQVYRYPAPYANDSELRLDRPEPLGWCETLDVFKPSIVDLHSLTSAMELSHLKAARSRGARTVATLHLPGLLCARGTLMRFGDEPCDGNLHRQPCTACRLHAVGVPRPLGRFLGAISPGMGERATRWPVPTAVKRPLTASLADARKRAWLTEVMAQSDRVVAVSSWLADALVRSGAAPGKIVLCRQGIAAEKARGQVHERVSNAALRVGFVGRADPIKGLHVLVAAARSIPKDVAVEFHLWCVARTELMKAYLARVKAEAATDARIIFHPETGDSSTIYAQIDVLAVPSLCFETGPIVVLEAQAARVPVVGSNIGGIAERVSDGETGFLVPPGDVPALARVLTDLVRHPARLHALRVGGAQRTMADAARETLETYGTLLQGPAAGSPSDGRALA